MQSDTKVEIMELNFIRHLLKGRIAGIVWGIVLLSGMAGCSTDYYQEGTTDSNGLLKLEAKGASSSFAVDPIQDIRMLVSYRGGVYDGKFSYEIYNIERLVNSLTSQIRTGDWNLTLLSPQGKTTQIHNPVAGQPMAGQLMYEYTPALDKNGKSTPAAEFLFGKAALPTVNADQTVSIDNVTMARNVAKVEFFVEKASNIDLSGTQKIELIGVPSKIDWEGHLMPSKNSPDALSTPLVGTLKFKALPGGGFASDTLAYIIPAHRGTDFLNPDGSLNPNPQDIVVPRMSVRVFITNGQGEVMMNQTKELPMPARCNQIMRVKLKLTSLDLSLSCDFSMLPVWEEVVSGDPNLH